MMLTDTEQVVWNYIKISLEVIGIGLLVLCATLLVWTAGTAAMGVVGAAVVGVLVGIVQHPFIALGLGCFHLVIRNRIKGASYYIWSIVAMYGVYIVIMEEIADKAV